MSFAKIYPGKAADHAAENRIYAQGEMTINSFIAGGVETEDLRVKYGNGLDHWSDLGYAGESALTFRVVDPTMVPWSNNPALVTDNPFSVGSWTYGGNTQGEYEVADHFVGSNVAFKLSASGASKYYIASQSHLVLGGPYTGSPTAIGHYIYVNNRLHTSTGVAWLTGTEISVDVEGDASQAYGVSAGVLGGSAISCPIMKAGAFVAITGHAVSVSTLTGVEAKTMMTIDANTHGTARSVQAKTQMSGPGTMAWVRGLSLDEWVGGATITNSAGIYADTSIDIGTNKWFIYSLSTSPSYFSGDIRLKSGVNIEVGEDPNPGCMIATNNSQKLAFWGKTPILQPTSADDPVDTFTANSGTAINDASTFDGYTLKQVVKALRNIGILA